MIQALTLEELKKVVRYKYERDEQRVVGIMLARYDLIVTKRVIEECYQYWNTNTGNDFDIFWAGYGEYLPYDEQSDSKIIMNFKGNDNRAYYDGEAFVTIKRQLNDILETPYNDNIQLALVNYSNGQLHFNESFQIDLEQNLDENLGSIRDIMEWLTTMCCNMGNVLEVLKKLKRERLLKKIKGISISDTIDKCLGIVGLFV